MNKKTNNEQPKEAEQFVPATWVGEGEPHPDIDEGNETKKTIDRWLVEELTWLQYMKAIYAVREQGFVKDLDIEVDSFERALRCAFIWSLTKEGHDYWHNVNRECERIETIKNRQNGENIKDNR